MAGLKSSEGSYIARPRDLHRYIPTNETVLMPSICGYGPGRRRSKYWALIYTANKKVLVKEYFDGNPFFYEKGIPGFEKSVKVLNKGLAIDLKKLKNTAISSNVVIPVNDGITLW